MNISFLNIAGSGLEIFFVLAASVSDIKSFRISNKLIKKGLAVALVYVFITILLQDKFISLILGGICGFGIMFVFYFLGAVGAGDVKLIGICGLFSGVNEILWIIVYSFVASVIIGAVGIVTNRCQIVNVSGVSMHKMHFAVAVMAAVLINVLKNII